MDQSNYNSELSNRIDLIAAPDSDFTSRAFVENGVLPRCCGTRVLDPVPKFSSAPPSRIGFASDPILAQPIDELAAEVVTPYSRTCCRMQKDCSYAQIDGCKPQCGGCQSHCCGSCQCNRSHCGEPCGCLNSLCSCFRSIFRGCCGCVSTAAGAINLATTAIPVAAVANNLATISVPVAALAITVAASIVPAGASRNPAVRFIRSLLAFGVMERPRGTFKRADHRIRRLCDRDAHKTTL